jgi:hypothetical protein
MSKKITKKEAKAWAKTCDEIITDMGGVLKDDYGFSNTYHLNTEYGVLYIHIRKDESGSELFSLHTRWDNVDKVKAKDQDIADEMNPYSGKWNHYGSKGEEQGLYRILQWLRIIVEPIEKAEYVKRLSVV